VICRRSESVTPETAQDSSRVILDGVYGLGLDVGFSNGLLNVGPHGPKTHPDKVSASSSSKIALSILHLQKQNAPAVSRGGRITTPSFGTWAATLGRPAAYRAASLAGNPSAGIDRQTKPRKRAPFARTRASGLPRRGDHMTRGGWHRRKYRIEFIGPSLFMRHRVYQIEINPNFLPSTRSDPASCTGSRNAQSRIT
jgi:hypothetical protein